MAEQYASDFPSVPISEDVYRQIDPARYYGEYIKRGVRPDGRKLHDIRQLDMSDLLEDSSRKTRGLDNDAIIIASVRVTAEDSHMHCVIKAVPDFCDVSSLPGQEADPLITVDIDLPKQLQPYVYDVNGPCANLNFCVSSLLGNILNSGEVVSTQQLKLYELLARNGEDSTQEHLNDYIVRRKLSWKLCIQNFCEEYDGNLVDISFLATSFGLQKARLPIVLLDSKGTYGPYKLCLLDMETLEKANAGDEQALRILHINVLSISKQTKMYLNKDNVSQQLLERFKHLGYVGVPLDIIAVPYTVTFLKLKDDTFLVDPNKEEEPLGVNISLYYLCGANGSRRKQVLNLMGCKQLPPVVQAVLENTAREIIRSIAEMRA